MIRRADPLSRFFWFRYRLPGGRTWTTARFCCVEAARWEQRRTISFGWDVEPIRVPEAPYE